MKIAWSETIKKMRQMGYSEEEIEQMKKDSADAICRFIDQGREIILFVEYKGILFRLLGINIKGKRSFRSATPKELKESFFKDGWLKKSE